MTASETRPNAPDVPHVPVFSERLSSLLEAMFKGEAPNAGRFCGYCYTPIDKDRDRCFHCGTPVAERAPVDRVPAEVLEMFRNLRKRESRIVNGFAYAGLLLAVVIFIGTFAIIFYNGANFWLLVIDIVALFVLARVLAGVLGGIIGDEIGYKYARRKLAEDWAAYQAARDA